MQKDQILPLSGFVLTLAVLLGNHCLPHLQASAPHHVPVERFPQRIGEWIGGPPLPVDRAILERLSTARIIERIYRSNGTQSLDLTLLSADRVSDMHNPLVCLPDQGWILQNQQTFPLDDATATLVTAVRGDKRMDVMFWFTAASDRRSATPYRLARLRSALLGAQDQAIMSGASLMVRLIAPHTSDSRPILLGFARQIITPLRSLREHQ